MKFDLARTKHATLIPSMTRRLFSGGGYNFVQPNLMIFLLYLRKHNSSSFVIIITAHSPGDFRFI